MHFNVKKDFQIETITETVNRFEIFQKLNLFWFDNILFQFDRILHRIDTCIYGWRRSSIYYSQWNSSFYSGKFIHEKYILEGLYGEFQNSKYKSNSLAIDFPYSKKSWKIILSHFRSRWSFTINFTMGSIVKIFAKFPFHLHYSSINEYSCGLFTYSYIGQTQKYLKIHTSLLFTYIIELQESVLI